MTTTAALINDPTRTLERFRTRYSIEAIDGCIAHTNILDRHSPFANHLRRTIGVSTACNAHYRDILIASSAVAVDRRAAFRMGVCLGLLVGFDLADADRLTL